LVDKVPGLGRSITSGATTEADSTLTKTNRMNRQQTLHRPQMGSSLPQKRFSLNENQMIQTAAASLGNVGALISNTEHEAESETCHPVVSKLYIPEIELEKVVLFAGNETIGLVKLLMMSYISKQRQGILENEYAIVINHECVHDERQSIIDFTIQTETNVPTTDMLYIKLLCLTHEIIDEKFLHKQPNELGRFEIRIYSYSKHRYKNRILIISQWGTEVFLGLLSGKNKEKFSVSLSNIKQIHVDLEDCLLSINFKKKSDVVNFEARFIKTADLEEAKGIIGTVMQDKYVANKQNFDRTVKKLRTMTSIRIDDRPSSIEVPSKDIKVEEDANSKRIESQGTYEVERSNSAESDHYYKVKKYNRFGIKQSRVIRLSYAEFHMEVFDPKPGGNKRILSFADIKDFKIPTDQPLCIKMIPFERHGRSTLYKFSERDHVRDFLRVVNKIRSAIGVNRLSKDVSGNLVGVREAANRQRAGSQPTRVLTKVFTMNNEPVVYKFPAKQEKALQKIPRYIMVKLDEGIVQVLRKSESISKSFKIQEIHNIETDYENPYKIKLVYGKVRKVLSLIFLTMHSKARFTSLIYSAMKPELVKTDPKAELPKINLKVLNITWNVGDMGPTDIRQVIPNPEKYDIICIALQENMKKSVWLQEIQSKLEAHQFSILLYISMWEMMLVVFIKYNHLRYITNIETGSKSTGLAKFIGNKGGVLGSFKYFHTTFGFVCSHLKAGPNRAAGRNSHFREISNAIRVGKKHMEPIMQFSCFFWLGDLNYRINDNFDYIVNKFNEEGEKAVPELLKIEEMYDIKKNNEAFANFEEMPISFIPTYRLLRSTPVWSRKKDQCPSWCDRILWAQQPTCKLNPISYDSMPEVYGSDHRPVLAEFDVEVQAPFFAGNITNADILLIEFDHLSFTVTPSLLLDPSFASLRLTFENEFVDSSASIRKDIPSAPSTVTWEQAFLPVLELPWADKRFVARQTVSVLLWATLVDTYQEVLLGTAYLSLEPLRQSNSFSFDSKIFRLGREIGLATGIVNCDSQPIDISEETVPSDEDDDEEISDEEVASKVRKDRNVTVMRRAHRLSTQDVLKEFKRMSEISHEGVPIILEEEDESTLL